MLVYRIGVSLPKTRRIFFTKENYPQRVDTDPKPEEFDIIETE